MALEAFFDPEEFAVRHADRVEAVHRVERFARCESDASQGPDLGGVEVYDVGPEPQTAPDEPEQHECVAPRYFAVQLFYSDRADPRIEGLPGLAVGRRNDIHFVVEHLAVCQIDDDGLCAAYRREGNDVKDTHFMKVWLFVATQGVIPAGGTPRRSGVRAVRRAESSCSRRRRT